MSECEKCGSYEFYEEDGFHFCFHCQTQSQGFAKEVANDEDEYFTSKEIRIKSKNKDLRKKIKEKDVQNKKLVSSWNTIEAFNEIYIGFIRDFLKILNKNNLSLSGPLKKRFITIAMQIWFKYLRESEIAFVRDEHREQKIKLHPSSRYRDIYLLGSNSSTSSTEDTTIPPYQHSKNYCLGNVKRFGFGNGYSIRMIKNPQIASNPYYYNEDIYSNKYKDPRYYLSKEMNSKTSHTKYLNKFLFERKGFEENNSDPFLDFIKNMIDKNEITIENSNPKECRDEPNGNDKFFDELNYKNLVKERMSTKSRLMDDLVSFESCKQMYSASPFSNDLVCRQKLLALLFITIRLFNFNIYLSDLIRWCIDGNINYQNLFLNCKEERQIMWIDLATFINHRFPRYMNLLMVIRNMIIHCNIDLELFPKPELYSLIQRYLKDLNLPNGLILIIKKRYNNFIEYYINKQMLLKDLKKFTEYEVIAMIAILCTLRELFDLNGDTEDKYQLFKNKNYQKLFIWSDWLNYSKIRLNVIKAFYLNIRLSHCDVINLDEILSRNHHMFDFYKNVEISAMKKCKLHSHQIRLKLQDLFEQLFFDEQNFEWKERTKETSFPSFYPLTSLTDTILLKISNSKLKELLMSNFRDKLITPYCCKHDSNFHRCRSLFSHSSKKNIIKSFDFFESFQHLMELASIITCTELNQFPQIFIMAEKLSNELINNE